MYNDIDSDNVQSSKPTTRSGKRETAGNRETKDNEKTTNSNEASFVGFHGRFIGESPSLKSSVLGIIRFNFRASDGREIKDELMKH